MQTLPREGSMLRVRSGLAAKPLGLTATTVSDTEIDLEWLAPPGASSYSVRRSTTAGGPYTEVTTQAGVTFSDSGLDPETTYFYVVVATALGVESSPSVEASATTEAAPAEPPAAPTNLVVTVIGPDLQLDWDDTPEADSYSVLRSAVGGGPYSEIATPVASTYLDQTVGVTTWYYVVKAVNEGGTSAASNEDSGVVPPP